MKKLASIVVFGLICSSLGYYFAPEKTVERVKTVEVIKEVIVEKIVREVNRDIETTTTVEERPDGTTITTTTERDTSTEVARTDRETGRDSETTADKTTISTRSKKNWLATALVGVERQGTSFDFTQSAFTGVIQRRILGEVYAGIYGSSNGDIGLAVSLRF